MALSVHIKKRLHKFTLKIDFESEDGILSLLGASGCGKSMTLKCIAGIETPDSGVIQCNGVTLFDSEKKINLPPQKRKVGYLFQQYALFPHMNVEQNIRCGIRYRKETESDISLWIQKLHLEGLEKKMPRQLSGGEQQRVALARILINEPEILLLDEPFSALDAHLRFQIESELRALLQGFHKPVLLVSHDRDEVYRMSDRIALMEKGVLFTCGSKDEVFDNPQTLAGARLTGCKNVYSCEIRDEHHLYVPELDTVFVTDKKCQNVDYIGIRMHDVHIGGDENVIKTKLIGEMDNPFTTVGTLETANGGVIRLEMDKMQWKNVHTREMNISVPADKVLLLKSEDL